MEICGLCGSLAPRKGESCEVCGGALSGVRRTVPSGDLYFVNLRVWHQCRKCLRSSPIDGLDWGETIRCVRCGFEVAFDASCWAEVLERAQAVGDLHGPAAEGRVPGPVAFAGANPLQRVGIDRGGIEVRQSGSRTVKGLVVPRVLQADLTPGHPLCDLCQAPLQIRVEAEALRLDCGPCGSTIRHNRPPQRHGLLGVISESSRQAHEAPDAVALGDRVGCASCGAPLQTDGRQRIVKCGFCGAMTHLAPEDRHKLQADPQPEPWWVVFEGPSPERLILEQDPSTWKRKAARGQVGQRVVSEQPLPKPLALMLGLGMPGGALLVAGAGAVVARLVGLL